MKCSIIIPAYDEEEDISNCLSSLSKQTFKDFDITIVDDGCTDDTIAICAAWAKAIKIPLTILVQDHKGPGAGRNLGALSAKGDILIFIDADMTFSIDYLENLIKPILKNKDIIGTTHDYEIATNVDQAISKYWGEIRVSKEDAPNVKIFRAIRKDKFLELGGFDPKYSHADDQTLWFKHGIKPVVAENTTCYHKNPATLKGTFKQARWIGASWRERFSILKIPVLGHIIILGSFILLPFAIVAKTIMHVFKRKQLCPRIFGFYSYKFSGYLIGAFRAIFMGRFSK